MLDLRTLSPAQRRHFYRRVAIAPLCLCLVAALHLTRVMWSNQTPWKGGGFGMFSTVDSESARFLRAYLVLPGGEVPLPIPEALAKREAEIRAAPNRTALNEMARRLAGQRWRWRDSRQERQAEIIAAAKGEAITAAMLDRPVNKSVDATSRPTAGSEHVLEPVGHDDADPNALAFTAVRVECWRYRFDKRSGELRAEKMLDGRASRQEVRP
jgi:hypothetical protein